MADDNILKLAEEADTMEIAAYIAAIIDAYQMNEFDAMAAVFMAFMSVFGEQETLH